MQQGAEFLIKEAAVKLAAKMHLTDTAIKQVAELQVIALRLFSSYDEKNKNLYLDNLRFRLKNEVKMNYRNVLEIKKLLEQRVKGEIHIENFQEKYLAQIVEAKEIKILAEMDEIY